MYLFCFSYIYARNNNNAGTQAILINIAVLLLLDNPLCAVSETELWIESEPSKNYMYAYNFSLSCFFFVQYYCEICKNWIIYIIGTSLVSFFILPDNIS